MTTELKVTLADHAAGNYRVLMNLADELLTVAADRDLPRLDEKLFLDVFAPTPKPKPTPTTKTMIELRRLLVAPELRRLRSRGPRARRFWRALLVEHPALADEASYESRVGHRARDIVRVASRLRRALLLYRLAVDETLDDVEHELPL